MVAARLRRLPSMLHEQNAVLGRANRMVQRSAMRIATSFDHTRFIADGDQRARNVGNPVREQVRALRSLPYRAPGEGRVIDLVVFGRAAAIKAGVTLPGGQPPVIDIGSEVAAGQLLATLDVPELVEELTEKKAAVARAEAERVQALKELEVSTAQIATAESATSGSAAWLVPR